MISSALLTQHDVKAFILNAINEILYTDTYLNRLQLSKTLKISVNTIDKYRVNGMPYHIYYGKTTYKLNEVIKWLEENNKNYNKDWRLEIKGNKNE